MPRAGRDAAITATPKNLYADITELRPGITSAKVINEGATEIWVQIPALHKTDWAILAAGNGDTFRLGDGMLNELWVRTDVGTGAVNHYVVAGT